MNLTASQRKVDAFLIAEALTHWFAQVHLGTTVVVPLETHTGSLVKAGASAAYPKTMPKYFRHSVKPGAKSVPDFLAFSTVDQVHVLESKGRAGFNGSGVTSKEINAARNKALRQVCAIATVNGLRPATRTACVFAFDQFGLIGQITDPPETRPYNYVVEWPRLIRQTYAAVLNPMFESFARDIGDNFIGIEFMPGWRFGIDREVYKLVRTVEDAASAQRLLSFLSDLVPDDRGVRGEVRSVGRDGFILTSESGYFEKIQIQEGK